MFFGQKCKEKGVFLSKECITRRQFSQIFGATYLFSAILFIKDVILQKCKRTWYVFWTKMQENGGVFEQRVYYLTTILKNFGRYTQFFSNFVHKRVHFCKICKKNSMFKKKKKNKQKKGCLFDNFCMRKGMVSEAALAHLRTKINALVYCSTYRNKQIQ